MNSLRNGLTTIWGFCLVLGPSFGGLALTAWIVWRLHFHSMWWILAAVPLLLGFLWLFKRVTGWALDIRRSHYRRG